MQRETREFGKSSSENRWEFHVPVCGIWVVRDIEALQYRCWWREGFQQSFEMREVRDNLQSLESGQVAERGGKEGFHVIIVREELYDVEKAVS